MKKKDNKRILTGTVVSNKMKDTVVVAVTRFVKNAKYQKFMKTTKRVKAHNPGNTLEVGDKAKIQESKPISKEKHFIVVN